MLYEAATRPAATLPPNRDRHNYLSLTTYRRDPRVTVGPSDGRGRLRGATFEAVARFAPAADEPRVMAMFDRKYPVARPVLLLLWRVAGLFGRRPAGREIILAITPAGR
jgi:hypothetical protein